jgi:glutamyl-tRNA synthetase
MRLRPHPGQLASAANLRRLLDGSPIVESHRTPDCTRVQDAYSLRCAPQVAGATRDTLAHAEQVATRELAAVIDNPVVTSDGRVESNGNFHGAPVAYALDFLAIPVADLASMSDPVLIREDGTYLYTLPSVVDDIEMGVTHVIRGDDHVTNTGAQIAIFRALGATAPNFGHHNLLTAADGTGLSKRSGALSIGALRDSGLEPMAVASLAVLTGSSDSIAPVASLEELAERFDPANASKSSAKFDPADLWSLNRALIHTLTFEDARERLSALGIAGPKAEAFWHAVRDNLEMLEDAADWWRIVTERPVCQTELSDEDRAFAREAFDYLPPEPWDETSWKVWTHTLKEKTGRKGKALFMPLRIALTGRDEGPEIANLLPLLGREGTLARRP